MVLQFQCGHQYDFLNFIAIQFQNLHLSMMDDDRPILTICSCLL